MIQTINAALYKSMIESGAALLEENKQLVNDLNVFPVPDGDTGTNMSMTLNAGVKALESGNAETVTAVADAATSALLRGARGNSGVILSLLFRGMSKVLKGVDEMCVFDFSSALSEGVTSAYKAVMRPTEGTILTVSRLMADRAAQYAEQGTDFEELLEAMLETGYVALKETTDQNPVLKKAGVVDSGGQGYIFLIEGMLMALRGSPVISLGISEEEEEQKTDFTVFMDDEITFAFDTVFIVRKTVDKSLEPLRAYLNGIGDSLVIGEDDEAFKVHVHTNTPGDALTEAQKYGTLELAKIENMRMQYEDIAAGRKAKSTDDLDDDFDAYNTSEKREPEKKYGTVAVCAGAGMEEVFRNLGVDALVTGGQTMNPSTEDILKAVQSVPAEIVFVLPNNKNIIMAAQQCNRLTEKKVVVIPSKTVPQGVSAMISFDDTLEEEELTGAMSDACGTVRTAQITYASRDSEFDGMEISAGEYLALLESSIVASGADLAAILDALCDRFAEGNAEVITVYYGEDVDEEAADAVAEKLESRFPDADVTVVSGGQPVYYYMISAE